VYNVYCEYYVWFIKDVRMLHNVGSFGRMIDESRSGKDVEGSSLVLMLAFLSFLLSNLPPQYRYGGLLLYLITLNDTHTR